MRCRMKNYLLICVVAATMGASSVRGMETESPAPGGAPSTVGAVTQPGSASPQAGSASPQAGSASPQAGGASSQAGGASPTDANADSAKSCEHVLFSRK